MLEKEKNICTSLCVKYTEEELFSCKKHIFPQIFNIDDRPHLWGGEVGRVDQESLEGTVEN